MRVTFFFLVDEPALLSSFCTSLIVIILYDPFNLVSCEDLALPRDTKVWTLISKAINPVPKQQRDVEYDSSMALSFFVNSFSVLQSSLTFLTCVSAQRELTLSDLFGAWSTGWILFSSLDSWVVLTKPLPALNDLITHSYFALVYSPVFNYRL